MQPLTDVHAPGRLFEPTFLKVSRSRLGRVVPAADRQEALRFPIGRLNALRATGQIPASRLGTDAVVQLDRHVGAAQEGRHRPLRLSGVIQLPTGNDDIDTVDRGELIGHRDQPVIVPLRIIDGHQLGGRVEAVEQTLRVR